MPDPSTHRKLLLWVRPDSRAFIMMWAGTPPRRRRARDCLQTSCLIAIRTAHHPTPASCPLQDRSYLGCSALSSHTENPVSPDGGRPRSGEMGVSVQLCTGLGNSDLLTLLTPCTPKPKRRLSIIQPERKILSCWPHAVSVDREEPQLCQRNPSCCDLGLCHRWPVMALVGVFILPGCGETPPEALPG